MPPTSKPKRRAIVEVYGETGTGKTDFAIKDTPGPIDFFPMEPGLEGLEDRVPDFKTKLRIKGMPLKPGDYGYPSFPIPFDAANSANLEKSKELALPIWDHLMVEMRKALTSNSRTNVFDWHEGMFDLGKTALIGSSTKVGPDDDPYNRMLSYVKRILGTYAKECHSKSKNTIFITRAKQVWEGNKPKSPAEWEPTGFEGITHECQYSFLMSKVMGMTTKRPVFSLKVVKSRKAGDTNMGRVFKGEEISWPVVMAALTNTDEGEWE